MNTGRLRSGWMVGRGIEEEEGNWTGIAFVFGSVFKEETMKEMRGGAVKLRGVVYVCCCKKGAVTSKRFDVGLKIFLMGAEVAKCPSRIVSYNNM